MKLKSISIGCLCGLFLSITTSGMVSRASQANYEPAWGTITNTSESRITLSNQSPNGYQGEIIALIADQQTKIIDVTTGYPMAKTDLVVGQSVYVYTGNVMTLSIPPQTTAHVILGNIPQDYRVPAYIEILSFDGTTLTSGTGDTYIVPDSATLLPYLTKNMVTKTNLTTGRTCLIWLDGTNTVSKLILFAPHPDTGQTGWVQLDGSWYYYNEDGTMHTGWLFDQDKWYYLNPQTYIMQTGFINVDGKIYYLTADGSMLTASRTFTPDADGVLH